MEKLNSAALQKISKIVEENKGRPGPTIVMLHKVQDELGYIPFEAMEKIGAVVQYEHKESGQDNNTPILKIEDFQVPIPNDLERL